MQNSELVRVYDTSTRVHKGTILVDTPGLSSNDPRHKLALTSYLPMADAILLVTDVNQQLTKSLIDFVNNTKLVEKPMFLVITKCDTKTKNEVSEVKKYISDNINIPIENVICISALTDDMDELYTLFNNIQKKKNEIVTKAINTKMASIAKYMSGIIDELIKNSTNDSELDDKIRNLQRELNQTGRNIDRLISDASSRITEKGQECTNKFHDNVFTRLDSIIQSQGRDCDAAVFTAVNTIAQTVLQQYKKDIQYILVNMARERQHSINSVPLQSLETLDLSNIALNGLTYNLNLSSLGHEYDTTISGVVKVVSAATIVIGGFAAIKGTAGEAAAAAKTIDMVDTATDVASMASNIKTRNRINKAMEFAQNVDKSMADIETWSNKTGAKYSEQKRDIIETGVSWITDKFWGKPQRRRAINEYIDSQLVPEFSFQISNIGSDLTRTIGQLLHDEAQVNLSIVENNLKQLEEERNTESEKFKQRIKQLTEYRNILNHI